MWLDYYGSLWTQALLHWWNNLKMFHQCSIKIRRCWNWKSLQVLDLQGFCLRGARTDSNRRHSEPQADMRMSHKPFIHRCFRNFRFFCLRLFCGNLRKDRFCFNNSLKIWDESLLNSSSIIKWQTFFKSDAKVDKVIK